MSTKPSWDALNDKLDMDTSITPEQLYEAMKLYVPDDPLPDLDKIREKGKGYSDALGLHRLKLGTYANELQTKYGEETFKNLADYWGLKKSTLSDYGLVVERYKNSAQFCHNLMQTYELNYTLLRIAGKFPTVEERIAFALEARGNGWTCEGAEIEARKRLHPEKEIWNKLVSDLSACVETVIIEHNRVILTLSCDVEDLPLQTGQPVKINISVQNR